jgi:hypothetical protein
MWDHSAMESTEEAVIHLRGAVSRYQRATKTADRLRGELGDVIAAALIAGIRPRDVAKETGFTTEHIRRIARDHDVPRLREPTVTSRRKAERDAAANRAADA